MTMQTQDGRLIVIGGASRSGKTAWVKKQVAKVQRITAWDPEDQWAQLPGWTKATTRKQLAEALTKPGRVKVAYVAGGKLQDEFNFWAECVMYSGRYVQPLDCIAEELADVTTPGKAPDKWGILVRRGLKRGITIYAISQRWAEADKTAVGNASRFVLFRQSSGDDITYLAKKTRVAYADLDGLQQLEFVEKCAITGTQSRGKLRF